MWDGEESLRHLFEGEEVVPEICPWGWSPALVHELELAGVPRHYMPDVEWLRRLRQLSGRESTVPVQRLLGVEAVVCLSLDEVEHYVSEWGKVIMKSPWSSSGKGLMQTDNPNWEGWVQRILRLQGAVVVERLLCKTQDLAMEFWLKEGRAEYMGLNLFLTDSHGHFVDNIVLSEEEKEALLLAMIDDKRALSDTKTFYLEHLPQLAAWYEGPVGVDMLVTQERRLSPCVEINWRMTMGMVEVMKQKRFSK